MTDSPNIVMVVLDTLRKDVLSLYGGRARSPSLVALASDGVVYPNCVASSPWTAPSHASLFTGLLPSRHGVHETWDDKINQVFGKMASVDAEPLASYLGERGYETVCYSANANIAKGSGFERGFSHYTLMNVTNPTLRAQQAIELARRYGKTRKEVAVNLLKRGRIGDLARLYSEDRRLKAERRRRNYPVVKGGNGITTSIVARRFEEPFFLFVNLLEMHEPYTTGEPGGEPRPISDLFEKKVVGEPLMREIREKYGGEVEVVDSFLGRTLSWLKEKGIYDDSLVIVTSDHGQALKEKGFYGHGTFMHDEILEVPLIVKYPQNRKPKTIPGYQPLHRLQELAKDSLVGVADAASLGAEYAVAESFGIPFGLESVSDVVDFEPKRSRFDRPRKAVYKGGLKLVVDGRDGGVEEFSRGGQLVDPKEREEDFSEMVGILTAVGDSEFVLPS